MIPKISLPVSKSIGARFLVATYFAGTLPADPYFEDNDDLMVLQQTLLAIFSDEEPIDYGDTPIDVHASGTALRFVVAVCASTLGADFVITGTPRLCSRPMTPLITVLKQAGANIISLGENGAGPYRVTGQKLEGGEFEIAGNISSQFISALMLVAPSWKSGMKLKFSTPPVSRPYIKMTADLMKLFGIKVCLKDEWVEVSPGNYTEPKNFRVESDWSSASFFYEACSLGGGDLLLTDIIPPNESCQGDSKTSELFNRLGVESAYSPEGVELTMHPKDCTYISEDFKDYPDLVLPFAVACFCRNIKFRFSGVSNLRIKESDRIDSLTRESRKLGFYLESGEDYVEWKGEKKSDRDIPVIDPHDDHRVAMAFAMAVFNCGEIKIENPDVVDKSFADFWEQLSHLNVSLTREGDIMIIKKNLQE